MRADHRRLGGAAVVVAAGAIVLAACGGASPSGVASLATNSGGGGRGTATTAPKNVAARSLIEWANCMHGHGDPDQTPPTVDVHGVINVHIPGNAQSLSGAVHGGTAPCNQYLAAASAALRAASPVGRPPDQTQLVKFSQCMRANGVPTYPDPGTGGTTNFNGTGIDMNSPIFKRANNRCGKQIDAPGWWISGTGPPGDVVVTSGGPPPGSPSGAFSPRGPLVTRPSGTTGG